VYNSQEKAGVVDGFREDREGGGTEGNRSCENGIIVYLAEFCHASTTLRQKRSEPDSDRRE
jgi:hypothetical protein